MHKKLEDAIAYLTQTIQVNAAELGKDVDQEQAERILAWALNVYFELSEEQLKFLELTTRK